MKTKFLALSLALTVLLLAGCQGNEPSGGSVSPSPEQSESASPEQSESASPEQSESASPEQSESASPEQGESASPEQGESASPEQGETATPGPSDTQTPAVGAGASVFTPGTWLEAGEDSGGQYYFFGPDGKSGSTRSLENGTGVAFEYEYEDGSAVFHMGAADDNSSCTVEDAGTGHIKLQWDDGHTTDLTYVSPLGAEEFTFYSNDELCELAIAFYGKASGSGTENLTAGATSNEDGSVSIQVYENQGDHNSTAAWYLVDRFIGQGVDVNTGEAADLSSAGA